MSKDKNIVRLNHQGMSQRNICKTLKVSDRRVRCTKYTKKVERTEPYL